MKTHRLSKYRLIGSVAAAYLAANVLLFFANPYSSQWHYESRDPIPIRVTLPTDAGLSIEQIRKILDSIDLAYGAREPSHIEELKQTAILVMQLAFLPSTVALTIKGFMDYIGPANSAQAAFTLSVKQRYNHLAKLGIKKGMKGDGFLYVEDALLAKENGQSFQSLRVSVRGNIEK